MQYSIRIFNAIIISLMSISFNGTILQKSLRGYMTLIQTYQHEPTISSTPNFNPSMVDVQRTCVTNLEEIKESHQL